MPELLNLYNETVKTTGIEPDQNLQEEATRHINGNNMQNGNGEQLGQLISNLADVNDW